MMKTLENDISLGRKLRPKASTYREEFEKNIHFKIMFNSITNLDDYYVQFAEIDLEAVEKEAIENERQEKEESKIAKNVKNWLKKLVGFIDFK